MTISVGSAFFNKTKRNFFYTVITAALKYGKFLKAQLSSTPHRRTFY